MSSQYNQLTFEKSNPRDPSTTALDWGLLTGNRPNQYGVWKVKSGHHLVLLILSHLLRHLKSEPQLNFEETLTFSYASAKPIKISVTHW